jgi:type IV secretory pathway VirB10-like protein
MDKQQDKGIEVAKSEDESEKATQTDEVEPEPDGPESDEPEVKPGFLETLRRSFERSRQAAHVPKKRGREELRRDKTRTLVALGVFTAVIILMFIFVFSTPPKSEESNGHPPGTPDIGQRTTPGGERPHENVTPLMSANSVGHEQEDNGQATAEDVARTARPVQRSTGSEGTRTAPPGSSRHTLADIDFQDRALEQQYAMHGTNPPQPPVRAAPRGETESDDLKAPSLVFVAAKKTASHPGAAEPAIEPNPVMDLLPVGTHLVARLEAPVSSALKAPAVGVIEYNYEQDGQIILPAGTKVIGKLRSATPQGYVSIEFNRLEFQDGAMQKIEASAMGLDYKPLKGHVMGRNRGLRFLVQSLTGVGEIGAYMLGGNPGSTSVFSEDALLREQLAANMAMAGQEQFNELAMRQHIVVTVPGNTRFYLVLEQGTTPGRAPASVRRVSNPSSLPSTRELMELMELKRELAAVGAQQAGSTQRQPVANSTQ